MIYIFSFRQGYEGHVQTRREAEANNSQHKTTRKTSISFYASMNEIISPKHSNESKIKTDASVIFGGDNKGCGCQTQIQLSTRYTSIFFGVELLFFLFSLFRLIRNKNIYVHENKNTSESQSARSDRLRKNTFCVHVHNCTENERERNHHKMTQDQIKTTSGTVVIDACTKESDGRFCL